jgi:amphi-Trp domain-containing protein
MNTKPTRDIEKEYPHADFVAKLRRLADAIENGKRFTIEIAGERIYVPVRARFTIEHERSEEEEEIEFQIKWSHQGQADEEDSEDEDQEDEADDEDKAEG